MRRLASKVSSNSLIAALLLASLLFWVKPFAGSAYGAYLGSHAITMSDNTAGAHNVTYDVSFTIATPGTLGSVEIQFCDNSPLIDDPCDAPVGFDASGASVTAESGVTDFTIDGSSTANNIILTRTPTAVGAVAINVTFSGVINPANYGSYFAKIITHSSADASGGYTDNGGIAFTISPSLMVSSEVPPYLVFCAGVTIPAFDCNSTEGDFIDLGDFTPTETRSAQSQFMAATNGGGGYSIYSGGTTLTSGNNTINTMNGETAKLGVSQFGLNLAVNTSPAGGSGPTGAGTGVVAPAYNQPNHFKFIDGDRVAFATTAQEYKRYTATYVVNVAKDQAPGVYSTTLSYVCLANF